MTNPIAVLLIEDNPGDARLVREWLKVAPAHTYRLEHVESLTAGLDLLQEDRFDVVLLDLGLPDSHGLDALSRVFDTTPEMAVLVLTGQQDEQVGLQAVKQGAQDYLLKGQMNGAALFRTIRYAIERQRSEEELRRSSALLGAIIEGTTDRIFAKDSDGRFLLFSSAASAFTGKISAEVLGKDDTFLFPPEEAQGVIEADRRVMESGTTSTFEEELTSSSGETRTFLSTKGPIVDDHGEVAGLFGISRDITDMKRAEDELRESGERYRLLFESMPAGVAHCRMIYRDGEPQDFEYLDVNESFGGLTGLTDVVGKRVTDVTPGIWESNPELFDIYGRVASGGGPERFETYVDGFGWLDISVYSPMAEHFIAVFDDATARKETQAALLESVSSRKANEAKTEFLSRMSHELRTPLNAILGFGQLLELDDLRPEQDESVKQILTAGHHLLELIKDVLDISRIEAGAIDTSVAPVAVREVVRAIADLMTPMSIELGVSVAVDETASPEACALANLKGLRQVLLNLVSNAIKYNVPGGTVVMTVKEDGDDRVLICVSDTGSGIAVEDLDRLWAPFDRLGAEAGGVQGTGLGLSVSKALVERMGGTLTAESRVGKGSAFTVCLERVAAAST